MPGLLSLSPGYCCFYPRHLYYSNKTVLEVLTQSHITPIIFFTSTLWLPSSDGKNHANTQTNITKILCSQPFISHPKPHSTFSLSFLLLNRKLFNLTENNGFFYQDLFSVSLLTNFPPSIYLVVFPSWNVVVCSLMVAYLWIPSFHGQAPKKEFVVLYSSPSIYFFKPVLSGFEFLQKQTLRQGFFGSWLQTTH